MASKERQMAPNSPFRIRIEKPEVALTTTMAEMRSWLDKHEVELAEFRIERTATLPNIAFVIRFRSENEAVVFAQAFA